MIKNAIIKSFMSVPKIQENIQAIKKLKEKATFKSYDYITGDKIITEIFIDTPKYLTVPRFLYKLINETLVDETDLRVPGDDIAIETKIVPRNEVQIRAINDIVSHDNILVSLPPGKGKTVIAIAALAKIKKKCAIIVHKNDLVNQWKDRFKEFTNLTDDDISVLKTDKLEESLKKPIVIMTVQSILSLLSRRYDEALSLFHKANFGVCIFDECHVTVSAEKFSESNKLFPVKRVIGLSATPRRSDGKTDVIFAHLGDYIFTDTAYEIMPIIIQVNIDLNFGKTERWFSWSGKFARDRYVKKLAEKQEYLDLLVTTIKFWYDEGKNILLLSEQIKLLEEIKIKTLERYNDLDIESYHSAKQLKTMKRSGEVVGVDFRAHRVITSNYGMLKDGADAPHLDLLIYSSPIKNDIGIEQSVGRITRKYPGKTIPVVIDFVDIHRDSTKRWGDDRRYLYNSREFQVYNINCEHNNPEQLVKDLTEVLRIIKEKEIKNAN